MKLRGLSGSVNKQIANKKGMGGLAKLCKLYGSIEVSGQDGKKIIWVWDYAQDKPRLKSEMTDEDIKESEKAKWIDVKNNIEQEKQ